MTLITGARLGPYQILSALGAGGMGEVYRARDTKLNRDVAIKVLLPAVANDPDRLARFSREAQVLASLNHPNIAHIHGIEEADGVTALVLELVEGNDLAQRIARCQEYSFLWFEDWRCTRAKCGAFRGCVIKRHGCSELSNAPRGGLDRS